MLKGVKVVTSGPSVKERTTTPKEPKEKEDKFKLSFGFKDKDRTSFKIVAEDYTLTDRKSRLGALITPMFFEGKGNQATAIIVTALTHAKDLNKHSDAEWLALIENRNEEECDYTTFDNMDRVGTTLFCNVIRMYAKGASIKMKFGTYPLMVFGRVFYQKTKMKLCLSLNSYAMAVSISMI